ncbi:MAG TPA: methyltransferase domain-containing protein [Burkholderiales bacterium]
MHPPAEIYTQRANPAFEAELAHRSAARDAAFLLPWLRPGMRLLDVGCGPGAITLGLAEAVAPGQVVGIDIQPAQVEQARSLASTRGAATVSFEVGSIYALAFPERSFDAVFANGVVMHLREPVRALAELRRVLRPGGIAGVRDPDFGATLYAPLTPVFERLLSVRARVRRHNGGDPFLGRHYRRLLLEAGFERAEAGASVDSAGSAERTRRHAGFLKAMLHGFTPTAVSQGWLEQSAIGTIVSEIDAWAQRPDAFYAATWCEAIGWASD